MGRLNDISLATQVAVFGNKRAFDQLVRQYQSPVRRFFLSQTMGDEMLSDDLAQDTFVKAYTHIGQYRGTSSFLTWLTRIAYNVWYDYKRKEQPIPQSQLGGKEVDTSGVSNTSGQSLFSSSYREGQGEGLDIYRALQVLKEEERTCITLQIVEGYSIDEIADMTKMPTGTVKSHLKRGKDKLANYLRQNGYDR
jgi:RNA polymerase sigma-70 factor (ECF subfamily)